MDLFGVGRISIGSSIQKHGIRESTALIEYLNKLIRDDDSLEIGAKLTGHCLFGLQRIV